MVGAEARYPSGATDRQPVLGLDIGGTKLAAAVVVAGGSAHGVVVEPTRREEGWPAVVERLFVLGRRAIADAGLGDVQAVGIACGGPLDAPAGVVLDPPNLPGWTRVPVGPLAAETFGVPAVLRNDASAAALAEYRFGAGRGADTMLYLTISTGIGGGVVLGGALHAGAAGNGGEFGHMTVRGGERRCLCGRLGCVEAYASGTSIAVRARELLARPGARSSLAELPTVTAADVSAAVAAGDPLARTVWEGAIDALGSAVTDLVNVFEPNVVVLGGGVTRSGAMLLDPIRDLVAREAMPPAAGAARIVLAGLGDLVGVVGAGTVAHDLLNGAGPVPAHTAPRKETHV